MLQKTTGLLSATALVALSAGAATAQNLITQNTSIHSSLCVGFDCATTESYGADTIRLKENNLRIHFDDTSTSGSFPNQDWRLEANSNVNGGGEYFRIIDATANRNIATFEANAPSNALVIDSGGRLGNGTANPAVSVHTANGNTPTVRLEQNGSSGWAPQTWDLAGNETSFFIRDATHGSTLPFRIRPSAPSNALVVDTDGDVGIGTLTSDASLHVKGSDGGTALLVEETNGTSAARALATLTNNGRPDMIFANTSTGGEWALGGGTNFVLKTGAVGSADDDKTLHFKLFGATGNLEITGEIITGGGTCGGGCDAVFTEEYDLPSVREHAEAMYSLGYLPNVGPTIENEPINVSDKLGRMLNELEHAHIYIAQQDERIADQDAQIAALTASVKALQESLADIER